MHLNSNIAMRLISIVSAALIILLIVPTVHAASLNPMDGDNSQWISNSPYATVIAGQQFKLNFTFQNDGTTTWSDEGGYALACDTHYHPAASSWDGISPINDCMGGSNIGFNGSTVPPGQKTSFTVTLTAPNQNFGESTAALNEVGYDVWFDMEHNGNIFGNNNVFVFVTVLPQNEQVQAGVSNVLIPQANKPLYDQNGNSLPARHCLNGGTQGGADKKGNAYVPAQWDVVQLAGLPSSTVFTVQGYQQGSSNRILVAYPDPCEPGLDFSDNQSIANGTGAVGYIDLDNTLQIAMSVVPSNNTSADWRDCWDPTQCGDASFSSNSSGTDSLTPAYNSFVQAWINGASVDPHWWQVLDTQGNPAAVYGRDWAAQP